MKITSLEIRKVPPCWVWLLVHTDTGIFGLGEPYLEGHADTVIAEVRRLGQFLIGRDPLRREAIWTDLYNGGFGYRGGPVTMSAISGIDMALWDIAGKHLGAPVYELLGGIVNSRIKLYRATDSVMPYWVEPGQPYSVGLADLDAVTDEPQSWARAARAAAEWGYQCLKLHFHFGSGLTSTSRVDPFIERFAAVRAELGADFDIAVDIHDPHPRLAMQLIAGLAEYRPLFVEEPVPQERIQALTEVARNSRVALAAGERWVGKWAFNDALATGALSVVQPDLAHAGGITECRKIAAIAEAWDAVVALHCPLSPIALAASIQLDAALPNFLVQEHNEVNDTRTSDGRTLIGSGYLSEPFELGEDGCVAVPTTPGLGIELDIDGLEQVSRFEWSTVRG